MQFYYTSRSIIKQKYNLRKYSRSKTKVLERKIINHKRVISLRLIIREVMEEYMRVAIREAEENLKSKDSFLIVVQ